MSDSLGDFAKELDEWLAGLEGRTHYEVLGIAANEDPRDAFHRFSERYHPDAHRDVTPEVLRSLRRAYQAGAEAYRILKNPRLRSEYDLELAKRQAPKGEENERASLEDLCRTKGGKLHARQAERALNDGNLKAALDYLRRARLAEGDNQALDERMEALRTLLFLSGA